jgi:hypothetical protein
MAILEKRNCPYVGGKTLFLKNNHVRRAPD